MKWELDIGRSDFTLSKDIPIINFPDRGERENLKERGIEVEEHPILPDLEGDCIGIPQSGGLTFKVSDFSISLFKNLLGIFDFQN